MYTALYSRHVQGSYIDTRYGNTAHIVVHIAAHIAAYITAHTSAFIAAYISAHIGAHIAYMGIIG